MQGVVGDRQGQSQRAPILKLKAKVEQAAAQLEKDKLELQREKVCSVTLDSGQHSHRPDNLDST